MLDSYYKLGLLIVIVNFIKYESGIVNMFLFCFETPYLLEIYTEVLKGKTIHLGFAFKNPIRKKKQQKTCCVGNMGNKKMAKY